VNDNEQIREAEALADEVVDRGYPTNAAVTDLMQQMSRGSFEFPSARLHEIYADTRLPLLTDDIRKIRVMSNRYQRAQGMQARAEREIPMLVANAREIIGLLRREYPE
jgi:hypothetical protein